MSVALFVAPNPSIGKTFFLENLAVSAVNRVSSTSTWPDGKAVLSAIAFSRMGGQSRVIIPLGGQTGEELLSMLSTQPLRMVSVPITGETRRTYSVSDLAETPPFETHILESGPELTGEEQEAFVAAVAVECEGVDVCCFAGSLPPGCPSEFYATLIDAVRSRTRCTVILDTSGTPLLDAASARPDCIKCNRHEFNGFLRGKGLTKLSFEESLLKVTEDLAIKTLIVTNGAAFVTAVIDGSLWRVYPPSISVANTVGSGDCFTAGYVFGAAKTVEERLKLAVAVASANAQSRVPGEFDRGAVDLLSSRVRIELVRSRGADGRGLQ